MALPYLLTLNKTARMAYPLIRSGVRQGLSSRRIAEALQVGGLGIRRSTILEVMKRERALLDHAANLKFLGLNRRPNPDRLPEALTPIRRRYSYTIELRGRIIDTQELITRNVTVASSNLLTRGQAENIARGFVEDDPKTYGIEVDKAQLINVQKAGDLGTIL